MSTATKPRRRARSKTKVSVTIATFDSSGAEPVYRCIREGEPAERFTPLTPADYRPRGGTPLLDATAQFIAHLERLRKKGTVVIGALADESGSMGGNVSSVVEGINEFVGGMSDVEVDPEADGKVLAVILTDGMENASREVTAQQVADMIREREANGWTFIYLGANHDAWGAGAQLGTTRSVAFTSSAQGTRSALRNAGAQAQSYLSSNAKYAMLASVAQNTTVAENGAVLSQAGVALDEAALASKGGE